MFVHKKKINNQKHLQIVHSISTEVNHNFEQYILHLICLKVNEIQASVHVDSLCYVMQHIILDILNNRHKTIQCQTAHLGNIPKISACLWFQKTVILTDNFI